MKRYIPVIVICAVAACGVEVSPSTQLQQAVLPTTSYGLATSWDWQNSMGMLYEFEGTTASLKFLGDLDVSCGQAIHGSFQECSNIAVDEMRRLYVSNSSYVHQVVSCTNQVCSCFIYAYMPFSARAMAWMRVGNRQRLVVANNSTLAVYDEDTYQWTTYTTDWLLAGDLSDAFGERYASVTPSNLATLDDSWLTTASIPINGGNQEPWGLSAASTLVGGGLNTWHSGGKSGS